MTSVRFEIEHREHDGSLISTHVPVAGTLQWSFRNQDYGMLQYGVAYSDPEIVTDGWAAKRTDVELYIISEPDGNRQRIWAGIHDAANLRMVGRDTISVTARSWLWWADQPYPFPAYEDDTLDDLVAAGTDPSLYFNAPDGDTVTDVIAALMDKITDGSAEQVELIPDYQGSALDEPVYWRVEFGDNRTILDHLKGLAAMSDPFGFDFWDDPDKYVRFVGPRLRATTDAVIRASFTGPSNGIVDMDWTNLGPAAVNTVAIASGTGNARRWSRKTYAPSEALYRDWTVIRDITRYASSLTDEDGVGSFAEGGGYQDRFPQKRLMFTIKPDLVDPSDATAFFYTHVAETVDVDYTFPVYHRVDSLFYIVAQEFFDAGAGNYLCNLTLDQVYV